MKKFIALLASASLAMFAMTACAGEMLLSREEIPVAKMEVDGLERLGIMKGTGNGMEAERPVTRAEALELVWRTTDIAFDDIALEESPFTDIEGHWAYDTIEHFYIAKLADGRGNGIFDPDGIVTGKELVKLLLTAMGYNGVTVENAYDKGVEADLLNNNFTKSVVRGNYELLRFDAARLCFSALTAKTPEGEMLYERLIRQGRKESDFNGVLYVSCTAEKETSFADRLNAAMPQNENYMFSPLSIKMAFAMAANGADGETRAEILSACGIQDLNSFDETAKDMIRRYSEVDFLKLNIANSIWLNSDNTKQRFSKNFEKHIADFYGGEAAVVNNKNAVKTINGWVSDKTNGKIDSVISDNSFISALVNAIYFKGAWKDDFYEGATRKEEFTNADNSKSQIDFMYKTDYMSYAEKDGVQIVKLPYAFRNEKYSEDMEFIGTERTDTRISMYVLLGEGNVENPESIINAPDGFDMEHTYVALSLPKFKTEFSVELSSIVKGLGIRRAFDADAQFEKMFDKGRGLISDIIHKTYINVDEKGTEAAAVTAIMVAGTSLRKDPTPVEMKVNHPFTYVIMDDNNSEVLFMGRYCMAE